jgi:hypothetical protein
VALQTAGRSKRASARAMETGDAEAAQRWLAQARADLAGLDRTAEVLQEEEDIAATESKLQAGDHAGHAKMAKYQHYNRSRNRPRQS